MGTFNDQALERMSEGDVHQALREAARQLAVLSLLLEKKRQERPRLRLFGADAVELPAGRCVESKR